MAYAQFENIRMAALACAVPSYEQKIDLNPERPDVGYAKNFVKNVGVKGRRISLTGQTGMDFCFGAAEKALAKTGWAAGSVDAVISLTYTPDYILPGNSHLLHYMLGMRNEAIAIDISLGCSSFPYGMRLACSLMQSPDINRAIIAFSNTFWPGYGSVENLKADNSFLFGEGGGVVLLEKHEGSPAIKTGLWSEGSGYRFLHHLPGARNPHGIKGKVMLPNGEEIFPGGRSTYMDGPAIMSFSTVTVVDSIKEFMARYETDIGLYDGLVLHQANLHIIKTMAKRLKVDMEKVPVSIDRYANTDTVSIPLTIADAYSGNEKDSLHLLASSFGIGLSWGVVDFCISPEAIIPVFTYDGIFEEGIFRCVD